LPNNKILTIEEFTKSYKDVIAVQDLTLEVERGEIYGFLGPNGAGKTTTIRTILNFVSPTSGNISVFGLDSVRDSIEIKKNIGYLAGDIALFENMKGTDALKYLTRLGKKSDWDYINELTERFEAITDRKIGSLSKGNKQKIGLIQAFMHKPDLIILDEPTSGLDPLMKQVFYDLILEIKNSGKTVFISSHDLTEVQKICDRAGFIKDGLLVASENIKNSVDINLRRYTVQFLKPPAENILDGVSGVTEIITKGTQLTFTVRGEVGAALNAISENNPIDLQEEETSLEDLFMKYYE
tara:strand:- start:228 stop:1115 length:888 start_codon:yes stop_codon:yes gene_type:complete